MLKVNTEMIHNFGKSVERIGQLLSN